MRNVLLLLSLFFLASNSVFAVPDALLKDGKPTFTVYDVSDNIALRNKLEANFDKKYHHCNNNGCYYDAPLGAYGNEVLVPYDLNKKPDDYKIISK